MTLTEQLTDYVHAAFTGLWVQTSEPEEAEREIVEHGRTGYLVANVREIPSGTPLRQLTAQPL